MSYPLQKADKYQFFVTDHGIVYRYDFQNITAEVVEHVSPILSGYDFSFHHFWFNSSAKPKPDPQVSETLQEIAKDFFTDNARVMLYVADSMDGRSAARQRLFKGWTGAGYEHTAVNLAIDEDVIHCGVVNRDDAPYKTILEQEFINRADKVFSQKF